jgi:hypothetical protein
VASTGKWWLAQALLKVAQSDAPLLCPPHVRMQVLERDRELRQQGRGAVSMVIAASGNLPDVRFVPTAAVRRSSVSRTLLESAD